MENLKRQDLSGQQHLVAFLPKILLNWIENRATLRDALPCTSHDEMEPRSVVQEISIRHKLLLLRGHPASHPMLHIQSHNTCEHWKTKPVLCLLLRSEIPSSICAKLRTVAASNNRDHARNLSSCTLVTMFNWSHVNIGRATYIMVLGFTHMPFVVNHTINATSPERLQHYQVLVVPSSYAPKQCLTQFSEASLEFLDGTKDQDQMHNFYKAAKSGTFFRRLACHAFSRVDWKYNKHCKVPFDTTSYTNLWWESANEIIALGKKVDIDDDSTQAFFRVSGVEAGRLRDRHVADELVIGVSAKRKKTQVSKVWKELMNATMHRISGKQMDVFRFLNIQYETIQHG